MRSCKDDSALRYAQQELLVETAAPARLYRAGVLERFITPVSVKYRTKMKLLPSPAT
jgi:hypothetical protein